ncbi:MAG: type I restriction-modification system subunit M N-terminal domain-containing protein [Thiobacillus sp.]
MFEQAFKNIDDVLWKEAGCASELDYTEQTSWLLFLKFLDGLEQDKAMEAELEGKKYSFILDFRSSVRSLPISTRSPKKPYASSPPTSRSETHSVR